MLTVNETEDKRQVASMKNLKGIDVNTGFWEGLCAEVRKQDWVEGDIGTQPSSYSGSLLHSHGAALQLRRPFRIALRLSEGCRPAYS